MKLTIIRCLLPCAVALGTPEVFAGDMPAAAIAGGKAETPVVATSLRFISAFTGYQAYSEQAVVSWREANDTVGRIGGWRAYAREAAKLDSAADPVSGRQDQLGPGGS